MSQSIASPENRLALRVNDAAMWVGLSRSTIYKLIAAKKLQTVKVAGRRLIPVAAIRALIEESYGEVSP